MIFLSYKGPEFDVYRIPENMNHLENQSEFILSNSIHTKLQMEYVQKFSITALFRQLNMYTSYLFNYLVSFLSSFFSITRKETEVSRI